MRGDVALARQLLDRCGDFLSVNNLSHLIFLGLQWARCFVHKIIFCSFKSVRVLFLAGTGWAVGYCWWSRNGSILGLYSLSLSSLAHLMLSEVSGVIISDWREPALLFLSRESCRVVLMVDIRFFIRTSWPTFSSHTDFNLKSVTLSVLEGSRTPLSIAAISSLLLRVSKMFAAMEVTRVFRTPPSPPSFCCSALIFSCQSELPGSFNNPHCVLFCFLLSIYFLPPIKLQSVLSHVSAQDPSEVRLGQSSANNNPPVLLNLTQACRA